MKTLSTEITSRGFTYRQIERRGNAAIYSQHLKGKSGKPLAYEVIIIKSHNGYTLGGAWIPPSEMYPGQESFGTLGWSYSTLMSNALEIALDKLGQVVQAQAVKQSRLLAQS